MTADQPVERPPGGDHASVGDKRNWVMTSTPPERSHDRIDPRVIEMGGDDRQVAALTRIAEALERLADDLESNHRGGRGVFDADTRR